MTRRSRTPLPTLSTSPSTPPATSAVASPLNRARRKAYWRLIPLLFVAYVIAFVDRANADPKLRERFARTLDSKGLYAELQLAMARGAQSLDAATVVGATRAMAAVMSMHQPTCPTARTSTR